MTKLLVCCRKTLLLRLLDRTKCSGNTSFTRELQRLHSYSWRKRDASSASATILTEKENLSAKYESSSVPELKELDFDDPVQTYKSKTTWEIARALLVLRVCSVNILVERNMQVRGENRV